MYKEVLRAIGALSLEIPTPSQQINPPDTAETTLPETTDLQKTDIERLSSLMNAIAADLQAVFHLKLIANSINNQQGSQDSYDYRLIYKQNSTNTTYTRHLCRYLVFEKDAANEPKQTLAFYVEKSEQDPQNARFCICISTFPSILNLKNENMSEDRQKYYRFADYELRDGLCYRYNKHYSQNQWTTDITPHQTDPAHPIIRETIKKNITEREVTDKFIELCCLIEDAPDKTEEQLRNSVLAGVSAILPYYRHVLGITEDSYAKGDHKEKNTILCGPPGTGKTYHTAVRAVAICDQRDIEEVSHQDHALTMQRYHELERAGRIGFTTFHQSFSYEDFIEGIRPDLTSDSSEHTEIRYKIESGTFKKFCNRADQFPAPYVFIIDEINRGNISRIFGELLTLIESSKRKGESDERSAILPYSHETFSVPSNVYLIGTMNTADRSIALLDTALRRRFSFVEMMPQPDVLKGLQIPFDSTGRLFIDVEKLLNTINRRIELLYDRDHTIGHAYFCQLTPGKATFAEFRSIFRNKIFPLLQEYFFDDYEKIQLILGDKQKTDGKEKPVPFIQQNTLNFWREFKCNASDFDDVMLPEVSYTINEKAFDDPARYFRIYY